MDMEQKIRDRAYQSPARARAALTRAHLPKRDKTRLGELVDAWEGEGTLDVVVGGVPVEDITAPQVTHAKVAPMRLLPVGKNDSVTVVGLDARCRARLTPYGVSLLYAARTKVPVPEDLMDKKGVWETTLWQLMSVLGDHVSNADSPVTVESQIEVLGVRG